MNTRMIVLIAFIVNSAIPQNRDGYEFDSLMEKYRSGEYRNVIPRQTLDRIESVEFSRRSSDDPWNADIESEYYAMLGDVTLDLVCNRRQVTSLEIGNYRSFFTRLQRTVIRTSSRVECNSNLSEAISIESLNAIYEELKNDRMLRNSSPGGLCFDRTYLISKKLNDLGIASEQLIASGWIIGAFEFEGHYGVEGYDRHNANIVYVENDGNTEPYVIDPMFFDAPIPLEEYKSRISVEEIENHYQIVPQSYRMRDERESCSYNEALLTISENKIHDLLDTVSESGGSYYYNNNEGIYPQIRSDMISSRNESISRYRTRFSRRWENSLSSN